MNDCGENFKSHPKYLVILIALLDHQKRKETCCIEFRLCLALMTHVIVNMIFFKQRHNQTNLILIFHNSIFLPYTPQQSSCHL